MADMSIVHTSSLHSHRNHRHTMEVTRDVDQESEAERIMEHYRHPTIFSPDVAVTTPETQAAFAELQEELHDFLSQYIPKVVALGNIAGGELAAAAQEAEDGDPLKRTRTASSTVRPGTSHAHGHDGASEAGEGPEDVVSDEATCNQETFRRKPASRKDPIQAHIASMHEFLMAHAENLRSLQTSMKEGGWDAKKWGQAPVSVAPMTGPGGVSSKNIHETRGEVAAPSGGPGLDGPRYDALNGQFNMSVLIATFTAALIITFLILAAQLLQTKHQTAYNVGMLFASFAFLIQLGNIVVAGRAAAVTSQQIAAKDTTYDPGYFLFYLSMCEQLQFSSTLLFLIAVMIMFFLVFISVAFPIVLLLFAIIASAFVICSVWWKVTLTLPNLIFLAKNFPRMGGSSVTFLKATRSKSLPREQMGV